MDKKIFRYIKKRLIAFLRSQNYLIFSLRKLFYLKKIKIMNAKSGIIESFVNARSLKN